ncbi:FAD-binding protein [Chitinophaga agrisoli]|uniref:FAD-binding protein n=1 Tax=Chitinophaga agrisoli TaxID=2607653 RepID=A0A5B2VML3_9BACT|nr:D-arabinono-1,4-lactone oxidase [Chitinophaga agrisoli]KAA2240883.1 FAD-binding protein [Chitinophaga agrisoli]
MQAEALKNWAGNYTYSTQQVHYPTSVTAVQQLVRELPGLRALGTRHCFNAIADSNAHLVSLQQLQQEIILDTAAMQVTVGAGMNYGQLSQYLHDHGLALHNLASLPHISIAGACATATHGSGSKNGNLATAVAALQLVTASGELVSLSREKDGDRFMGTVVSLGGAGLITQLTLNIQPAFTIQQYLYEQLPFQQLEHHLQDILSAAYSVSLFTDWQAPRFNQVWLKQLGGVYTAPDNFFSATPATRNLHPIGELSAEHCTEQLGIAGPWHERLPHFRMHFTPSSGEELQSEYFVPLADGYAALMALTPLMERIAPLLLISELRTIAADQYWMSPCYQQDCMAIHFTWKQDWPAVQQVLPLIEARLAPFRARPHWGKLFTMPPAKLAGLYERLPDFRQLLQEYDPQGKFRNAFMDTYIFGRY